MWVLDKIAGYFWDLYTFFNNVAWECWSSFYVPDAIGDFMWDIARGCMDISDRLISFSYQMDSIVDQVSEILTWSNIRSLIRSWLPGLEDTIDWWYSRWYFIGQIINDWWYDTRYTVQSWITNLQNWAIAELNSLQATFNILISNVETWTTTQINNATAAWNILITNVETWTTTQINNATAAWNILITNVETWTTTQINNARSAILTTIGDLTTWTQTEINNIRDLLTTIIDWDALWAWLTTWWTDRLVDIETLFNSWMLEWAPFWAGWQDWRDKVAEFFTDPVEFIWDRFTDWFLGPEA